MTLEEIRKEVREESEQKYENPCKRLESMSERALRYAEFLYRVKKERNKLKIIVNNKHSELYRENKFKSNLLLKNQADVESFIDSDPEYQKMKQKLEDLEAAVDFLDDVVTTFQQREATERLVFKFKTGIGG